MSAFGDTLKQIRKARNLRQADLAQALSLSQTTIANYEQGIRFPDEDVLNRLADHLNVSTDQLLGRRQGLPLITLEPPPVEPNLIDSDQRQLLDWLLAGNHPAARSWLEQQLAAGRQPEDLCLDLIQPVMYEVGRLWEAGAIDVFQEHAVTEQIKHLSSAFIPLYRHNPDGPRFLAFAVSGNTHEMGIHLVADLLQMRGWNTLFLGTNLPPASVLAAVRDFDPQVIGISAALDQHIPALQKTIYFLRNELKEHCPPVMVGGFVFATNQELARSLGADALALDGRQAIQLANGLIGR